MADRKKRKPEIRTPLRDAARALVLDPQLIRAFITARKVPELDWIERNCDLSKLADIKALLGLLERRSQQLEMALLQLCLWRYATPKASTFEHELVCAYDEELRKMFEEDRCAFKLPE